MKKLLVILGSIGMVSSWTTLVVACGGNSATAKQDLSIFNLSLGAFEDEPTDQTIIDKFNAINEAQINLVLITDVTIKDKTSTGATIVANPDSNLYINSAMITFTIKIDLKNYENTELGFQNDNPTEEEILTLFNKINNINLTLKDDVIIKKTENGITITAITSSQKVKGSVKIGFSKRKDLSTFSIKRFTYLESRPKDEQEVLDILNEENGTNLTLKDDVKIDSPSIGSNINIQAILTSKKVTGSVRITFKVKKDLKEYGVIKWGAQDKNPEILDIFNFFITKIDDELKAKIKLDVDVTIDLIDVGATIKAKPESKLVKGEVIVTFTVKTNLDIFIIKIEKRFNGKPTANQILEEFNIINKQLLNGKSISEKDVTIDQIDDKSKNARMTAKLDSLEYTGVITITFDLMINLNDFNKITLGDFKTKPQDKDIIDKFNNENSIKLNLQDDVIIENKTNISATIKANPNSKLYTGSKKVEFKSVIKPIKYLDPNDSNKEKESYDPDLSNLIGIKEITEFGYYESEPNVFELIKMPPTILKVPINLLSEVNSLKKLFLNNKNFNQDLSTWIVSNITDMSYMFYGATSFNQDISSWNVSRVKNMAMMFFAANNFDNNGRNLTWGDNTWNVEDMGGMFYQATKFNRDISGWNVSKVTKMSSMFAYTNNFNQDISSWNVSRVKNMAMMFNTAKAFNKPLNWKNNTQNVTDMSYMFYESSSFNQDISNWKVSSVTNMKQMFWLATKFDNGGNPLKWENENSSVGNVKDMERMFARAESFNQDISNWNVSNVINMSSMFSFALKFNQDISNWNVSNVINITSMFSFALKFNQNISNWNVSNVTDMNRMFWGTNNFNQDISNWNVSSVTDMSYMFKDAKSFDQDLSNWKMGGRTKHDEFANGSPIEHKIEWHPIWDKKIKSYIK